MYLIGLKVGQPINDRCYWNPILKLVNGKIFNFLTYFLREWGHIIDGSFSIMSQFILNMRVGRILL